MVDYGEPVLPAGEDHQGVARDATHLRDRPELGRAVSVSAGELDVGAFEENVTERYVMYHFVVGTMAEPTRFNIQLDEAHAAKLRALADRTHVNPGTLARSLLSTALDHADPEPETIVDILDAIPGAYDRAQHGLREVREDRAIPLDEM